MKIYWTDAAKEDVREIHDYLRQQRSSGNTAHQGTKNFPFKLADLNINTYRELLAGPHRIIFEQTPTAFTIPLVCHTSRDLEAMLQRRHLKP
ncbi:plasmid stabilization system protein ParE [Duganella sp. SG902]|uniref:type II toxin-antitoxin system RelE/ParE family toxin n=1 Tax=Duganella sp. SG902 TaxID=2587016 RepID=UPI00159D8C4C|nr:type II toxin-antitoxin system RelE/ParE family toxin [Duganella sp. SG902]NVM75079.1 plasmid stabilization system protein ParE [Duganella sp. SG902]